MFAATPQKLRLLELFHRVKYFCLSKNIALSNDEKSLYMTISPLRKYFEVCCNAIIKLSDRIKIFVEVYGHR